MPARLNKLKRKGEIKRTVAARPIKDPKRRLVKVIDLLEANLGKPVWDGRKDALEILVLTILSQNTTDPNALKGYQNLTQKYPSEPSGSKDAAALPRDANGQVDKVKIRLSDAAKAIDPPDWAVVSKLPKKKLADAIRYAGLPDSKSGAILAALHWIEDQRDDYRLEPLIDSLGVDEVLEKLTALKGIGPKTVTVTLIEAAGADLCPVDTHVHRLINRLGILDTKQDRDRTFRLLRPMMPDGRAFGLHHNLLTFGRTICTARSPKCGDCFLKRLCPSREDQG
ncbi:MAG: endonuclease III domain-containing protein [Planctomycetota bacterium]|jgi:endonuclease-3